MERFERQMLLHDFGIAGQKKLLDASVLVIGAGGLGSPLLFYLAAAGVGRIHILDGDVVSASNLNRQILYGIGDIGRPKSAVATERLAALYPDLTITGESVFITDENVVTRLHGYGCVVLCLDSIEARRIVNRGCVENNIPYIEGAVSGFHGSISTVLPHKTACYECTFSYAKQPAAPISVVGAAAGIVGSMMALAVIHLLLGIPDASLGNLIYIDTARYENTVIPVERNPNCPVCGKTVFN